MDRLTLEQTMGLIEKGILVKNGCEMVIDKVSKNDLDTYTIDNVCKIGKTIRFNVINLETLQTYFIDYRQIKKIDGQNISNLLKAFELTDEDIIETIDIETDVVNDVIGKTKASIDGFNLKEGMKFILEKDKTPKYCNKVLTVRFTKGVIRLAAPRGRPKN